MTTTKPRQALPGAPRHDDGRPYGTRCTGTCRPPVTSHCHCSVCHQTMRSLGDFDAHRSDGWCLDLSALGLIERDRLWATPEGHAAADASRARLASVRSQGPLGSAEALTAADGSPVGGLW